MQNVKKKDIMLILMVLIIAAVFYLCNSKKAEQGGDIVIVEVDGVEYGRYDLNQDKQINIEGDNGFNLLVVEGGKVYMEQADCPDKHCVDKGKIYQNGETIICLPHRVVVQVKAKEQADLETTKNPPTDGMAQ